MLGFRFSKFIEFYCERSNIIPCFQRINTSKILILVSAERSIEERTNLIVQIDTVNEAQLAEVISLNTEEVILEQFLITSEEVTTDTRKLVLNLALDTSIFKNVQIGLDTHTTSINLTMPTLSRCEQCMSDLMTDKQVIKVGRHIFPDREDEGAVLKVEHRSGNLLMFNPKVLSGEQFSKGRLMGNRHHETSSINIFHSTLFW